MAEIKINVIVLENKINQLKNLSAACDNLIVKQKDLKGSGEVVNIVNQIDMEYVEIKTTLQTLIDNSIYFFENVKSSMIQADTLSGG